MNNREVYKLALEHGLKNSGSCDKHFNSLCDNYLSGGRKTRMEY